MYIDFDNCWKQFRPSEGLFIFINFCQVPLFGIQIDIDFFAIAILGFGISIGK